MRQGEAAHEPHRAVRSARVAGKAVMFWFLLLLITSFAAISWLSPSLSHSAWQAFDSTLLSLSQGGDEDEPPRAAPRLVQYSADKHTRPSAPLRTSAIRKRITPFQARLVAARYGFKCAICGRT